MSRRSPLAVVALVAALLTLGAGSAAAAPAPIKNAASALCVDVDGGTDTAGARVIARTCDGGATQAWEFDASGRLRTLGGARCLDAAANGNGTYRLVSWPCHDGTNQRWRYRADRSIVGVASGACVAPTGGSGASGTALVLAACDGSAAQSWSAPAGSDDTAPTPPGDPRVSNLLCRSATLSWSASTDASGIASYDVYHDGQFMTSVPGTATSASLTLSPGATWGLYVNARDTAGNVSQASATVTVTVPQCSVDSSAPSVPAGPVGTVSGTSVALRWSAARDDVGVVAYDVYRDGAKVGSTGGLTFTDSGLRANTTYGWSVAARDAQGNVSGRSATLTRTTGASCSAVVCSVTQVATDTDIPWGLAALPDGSVLYSRRDADDIVRLDPATGTKTSLGTVPNVSGTDGEGGLLGIAVTPAFPATDPWIYIHHTSPSDNRVVRIRLEGGRLQTSTEQVLLSGIPRNKYHNGGRLRFGPDGKLYVSTGDAQNAPLAQDPASLAGKILRLNPDGTRPSDNPFGTYVWSLGHRNPQGLAFDAQGRLWEQEFGNSQLDETNLIEKGGNYGWPDCEGTISTGGGGCGTAGFKAPKKTYPVANGSCSGIAIVGSALFVACQRGARLYRHVISGSDLTSTTELFSGTYGRLRTVEPTVDGGLWLTTTNQGDKDSTAGNSNEKILKVELGG